MASFQNQGPQDVSVPNVYPTGPSLIDMSTIASGGGHSFAGNITAHAGGTRAAAVKLTSGINRIATCATAADSVSLPPAVGGQLIIVANAGAAAAQVFADPSTSDTINGVAAATGVSLAAGKSASFSSSAPGVWSWVLSA